MRNLFNKSIIVVLIFAGAAVSCNESKPKVENPGKYSIKIGEFKNLKNADSVKVKLGPQLESELSIKKEKSGTFLVEFGKFTSSYHAGEKAFELKSKNLIGNYEILKADSATHDTFADIIYVGMYRSRPSLFMYNIPSRKSSLLWSRWGRKVLSANYTRDRSKLFVATALGLGQQGSFPYVREARLYLYSGEDEQINEIAEFGTCFQIYTYWENRDTFKVNITNPDSIKTAEMIQRIIPFDVEGNQGTIKERTYHLMSDGFPIPPSPNFKMFSGKGAYLLKEIDEENGKFLYLHDVKKNSEVTLTELNGKIKNIEWSEDEKYLFIIFENNKSMGNQKKLLDKLLIVKTLDSKIMQTFQNNRFENLLVQGNFLFFDHKNEGVMQITVFDYKSGIYYDEIRIPGGCGINNLIL